MFALLGSMDDGVPVERKIYKNHNSNNEEKS